jgi:cell wall-associated NlpC family hydrolase
MAQVGHPPVWAAAGPNAFDCSGSSSTPLPPLTSTCRTPAVGIYIGNGQAVHASRSDEPVKTASIDSMGDFASARRIAG